MSSLPHPNRVPLWTPVMLILFLGVAVVLCWSHFLALGSMGEGDRFFQGRSTPWSLGDLQTAAMMWGLMMGGMMLPSAGPWLWHLSRAWAPPGTAWRWVIPLAFLLGYLSSWLLFSCAAAALQWFLHFQSSFLPGGVRPFLDGSILILAGLYQWSGVKDRCLTHCRSPFAFFLSGWRPGIAGGFRMGFRHGLFCVGCCWLLMLLAFVVGMMNLLWMILLTIYVFIDHSLLSTRWVGNLIGALLVGWGIWKMVT